MMTPEQKAALLFSESVAALAEIMGMKAHNDAIILSNNGVETNGMYQQQHFQDAVSHIGANAAIITLTGG